MARSEIESWRELWAEDAESRHEPGWLPRVMESWRALSEEARGEALEHAAGVLGDELDDLVDLQIAVLAERLALLEAEDRFWSGPLVDPERLGEMESEYGFRFPIRYRRMLTELGAGASYEEEGFYPFFHLRAPEPRPRPEELEVASQPFELELEEDETVTFRDHPDLLEYLVDAGPYEQLFLVPGALQIFSIPLQSRPVFPWRGVYLVIGGARAGTLLEVDDIELPGIEESWRFEWGPSVWIPEPGLDVLTWYGEWMLREDFDRDIPFLP
jgi:hypothetical protein